MAKREPSRSDSGPQRPAANPDLDLTLRHTYEACPGAVTSSVLRHIAASAGAFRPGVQEHLFYEPMTTRDGNSVPYVEAWFLRRKAALHEAGYKIHSRRLIEPIANVVEWVKLGKGRRGAVVPLTYDLAHPQATAGIDAIYANGIVISPNHPGVTLLDPWPGEGNADFQAVSAELLKPLDRAHRDQKYQALLFYWIGYS